jgi:hypothetical protein
MKRRAIQRMTLRYTQIAELLQDVIRWLGKELCVGPTERHARLLIRRLESVRGELSELQREAAANA